MIEDEYNPVLELTASVVSAYVSNNPLPASSLPDLIASVNTALKSISTGHTAAANPAPVQEPAVNPKKSVFPDYLICLEDGKKFKSLKRHIMSLGITPDEYRMKWKLPPDYPMVAPAYSAARSELAKTMGLGRKSVPLVLEPETVAISEPEPVVEPSKKKPRAKRAAAAVVTPAESASLPRDGED